MRNPPREFITRMPVTRLRQVTALARQSGCSRNAYLNQLAADAVAKKRILTPARVVNGGARKKANCKFV